MVPDVPPLDGLDLALLAYLRGNARAGVVELARELGVARKTAQAHFDRLQDAGVIRGFGPVVDVAQFGYDVQSYTTVSLVSGQLEEFKEFVSAIPEVVEAHVVAGVGDVLCRILARSHAELQGVLLTLAQSPLVRDCRSTLVLSELIPERPLSLVLKLGQKADPRTPAATDS